VDGGEFALQAVPIPGQPLQLFFNTRRVPTDDPSVRRALLLAVDRPSIVATVFGEHSAVAEGLLSANTPGSTPVIPAEAYDPAEAAALLDSAGWVLGADGDAPARVNHSWSNSSCRHGVEPRSRTTGERGLVRTRRRGRAAGCPGFGPLKEAQAAGEYNVIGVNLFGSDPDVLRPFFTSDGLYNWSGWADPQLDALLVDGAESVGPRAERMALYGEAAGRVADQSLVLPIRDYTNLVVHRRGLTDLRFSLKDGILPDRLRPAP